MLRGNCIRTGTSGPLCPGAVHTNDAYYALCLLSLADRQKEEWQTNAYYRKQVAPSETGLTIGQKERDREMWTLQVSCPCALASHYIG